MNQSRVQQRPQPWWSGALLGCTAVTQEGQGGEEKRGLLLKHHVVLVVCGAACVRAICPNRRCSANTLGSTELSVFPALLGVFSEPLLPVPPAGRTWGKHSPTSLGVVLKGFCSCGFPLWAGILQVRWAEKGKTKESRDGVGENGYGDSEYSLLLFRQLGFSQYLRTA